MRRRFHNFRTEKPDSLVGLSLIELVVVMAILGLLIAVSLPAISQARAAMRKAQCMNHLRNITFGMTQYDHFNRRLPASGYYFDPPDGPGGPHHSWAVSILPHIGQGNLIENWDLDKKVTDPVNVPLTRARIPVYQCPMDISLSGGANGDLSYAVNGGFGFTYRNRAGVGDCPLDWHGRQLDLNGDGQTCSGDNELDDQDRKLFKQTGLFFLENWKAGNTKRNHSLADIVDGTSQTFLASENVRTGYAPDATVANFADPNPYRSAFYIGNPCRNGDCSDGSVDYALCNSGVNRINSGLWSEEGRSPVPNSFHTGGVNMAYADGHLKFLSEEIDGAVYAALASPQGSLIRQGPLQQVIVSGEDF